MLFIIIALLILIILNMPIAFALGIAPTIYILITEEYPLEIIIQQMISGLDSFVYLAVPFFILAGELMTEGHISKKLIDFTSLIVGKLAGGLAMAVSLASMFFASISGSGPATTAAIGGSTLPALRKHGYGKEWSVALITASGTMGPLIPPSITMVIYGAISGVSIGKLFLAGIVPGVLIGIGLMVISYIHAKRVKTQDYLNDVEKITFKRIVRSFMNAIWAFGMPVIIMGGILGGVFTPTEAAVVGVVYAFIVCFFIYKTLSIKDIPKILKKSAVTSSVVMIILANASGFAWIIGAEKGPEQFVMFFQMLTTNKYLTLFMINIFLFLVGCLIDTSSAIIMTFPAIYPLAQSIGVSPIHLGILMCTNLIIGMATPPLGLTLFTACSIGNVKIAEVIKPLFPMLILMFVIALFVTYFPDVALFIPNYFMK